MSNHFSAYPLRGVKGVESACPSHAISQIEACRARKDSNLIVINSDPPGKLNALACVRMRNGILEKHLVWPEIVMRICWQSRSSMEDQSLR
jgi:hypothetical protein